MSNHLHLIVNSEDGFLLKDTIRDFKKYTSKKIIKRIEEKPESRREWMIRIFESEAAGSKKHKNYKFWKTGNHAIELINDKFIWDKVNYIHQNPVKDGYVNEPEHWRYSSAANYLGEESVLEEVVCLSSPLYSV